ncbi:MAG TPA: phosphopantetheine-binding protein [Chthoniobacter sp.]|nr:phosphopantetheine-binding protein [Chthoniobacter sp.]
MSQIDAVLEIVGRKSMLDRAQIVPETKLVDLGISSLNMVELICDIEEELGIELPFNANTRAKDFRTLGDVIAAVEKQLAAKG